MTDLQNCCAWCGLPRPRGASASFDDNCLDNPAERIRRIDEATEALRIAVRGAWDLHRKRHPGFFDPGHLGVTGYDERRAIYEAQDRARSAAREGAR